MEPPANTGALDITALPMEVLYEILRHLGDSWRDLQSLCAAAQTCHQLHEAVAHDPELWKEFALIWDPARVHDILETSRHSESSPDWFHIFTTDVFWNRTVLMPPGTESRYQWGPGYCCTLEKVVFGAERLVLFIDERGDYSLGGIQDPMFSVLLSTHRPGENGPQLKLHRTRPTASQWETADPVTQYKGWMAFHVPPLFPHSNVSFVYGSGGYSVARIAAITDEFILTNRIEHILAHWHVLREKEQQQPGATADTAYFEYRDDPNPEDDDENEDAEADALVQQQLDWEAEHDENH